MKQRKVRRDFFVAAEMVVPADMPHLASHGVKMVINNRPDGEEPNQPRSAEYETAARHVGLAYRYIPWDQTFDDPMVATMVQALGEAPGRVLAFCNSGTRSTWLWALARVRMGDDIEDVMMDAAAAGYPMNMIRGFLERSGQRGSALPD